MKWGGKSGGDGKEKGSDRNFGGIRTGDGMPLSVMIVEHFVAPRFIGSEGCGIDQGLLAGTLTVRRKKKHIVYQKPNGKGSPSIRTERRKRADKNRDMGVYVDEAGGRGKHRWAGKKKGRQPLFSVAMATDRSIFSLFC